MKKNKWMRLASVLLVLCLMTTSFICGTFAKYISSDSAEDSARVAKWGVVSTITGNLYGPSYLGVDDGNKITNWSKNQETVSAYENVNVVAPGTVGNEMNFRVQGLPEVSALVVFGEALDDLGVDANLANSDVTLVAGTYGVFGPTVPKASLTDDNIEGLYYFDTANKCYVKVVAGDAFDDSLSYYKLQDVAEAKKDYHPLRYTVTGDYTQDVNADYAVNTLYTALKGMSEAVDGLGQFAPNTLVNFHAHLSWIWEYEVNKPADSIYAEHDKEDTILGDMVFEAVADSTVPDKYDVVYMPGGDDSTCYPVSYKEVPVAKGADGPSDNKVWVAWYETEPKFAYEEEILADSEGKISEGVLAVLGAAVNVSLTCIQVD